MTHQASATHYPEQDFLEDYHEFALPCFVLAGRTSRDAAAFAAAFFSKRYSSAPDTARERLDVFLKAMVAIEQHHIALAATGYVTTSKENNYSRIQHDLLRALHRLIVRKSIKQPRFEQIRDELELRRSRN